MKIQDLEKLSELYESLEDVACYICKEWCKIHNHGHGGFAHFEEINDDRVCFCVEDCLPRGGGVDTYRFSLTFEEIANWKEWAKSEKQKKEEKENLAKEKEKASIRQRELAQLSALKSKYGG